MIDPTQHPTPWSIPAAWALPRRTASGVKTPRRMAYVPVSEPRVTRRLVAEVAVGVVAVWAVLVAALAAGS